jgi:predicted phosphoribosyltransferase
MRFANRHDAGRRLAAALSADPPPDPVVLALPRGGVPVARPVADALGAPLGILGVRKVGAPGNPEFAVGAIAEHGITVIDEQIARAVGLDGPALEIAVARERAELARRVARYRGAGAPLALPGRTAVLIDDGVATGLTLIAAIHAVRDQSAAAVLVAVPVAARESIPRLRREADGVVCLVIARRLGGVGRWYDDFRAPSDEEVVALLGS